MSKHDPIDAPWREAFAEWLPNYSPHTALTVIGHAERCFEAGWTARDTMLTPEPSPADAPVMGKVMPLSMEECAMASLAREVADLKARVEKLEQANKPQPGLPGRIDPDVFVEEPSLGLLDQLRDCRDEFVRLADVIGPADSEFVADRIEKLNAVIEANGDAVEKEPGEAGK